MKTRRLKDRNPGTSTLVGIDAQPRQHTNNICLVVLASHKVVQILSNLDPKLAHELLARETSKLLSFIFQVLGSYTFSQIIQAFR